MNQEIDSLVKFISDQDGINDKTKLTDLVVEKFSMIKDRSVYYNNSISIRFSQSKTNGFSNTILALSNLQKYDSKPFFVCVVCPTRNYLLISNSTFLKKISHSSQELSLNNIKGSFNGSDIMRDFNKIENKPSNFYRLYLIHDSIGFDENLPRLVDATNSIVGTGHEYQISSTSRKNIEKSVTRSEHFIKSEEYKMLKSDLDHKVKQNNQVILIASCIPNVNIRGRIIEYLIAGEDEKLRIELIESLVHSHMTQPRFATENSLGDYTKIFESYHTETDIKTKIMVLDSNPKAYNIDKMLEFLSMEKSVFLFYFIGINPGKIFNTSLVSMYEERLIEGTLILRHWAGRNSRGVTQLEGKSIKEVIENPSNIINAEQSNAFIQKLINAGNVNKITDLVDQDG